MSIQEALEHRRAIRQYDETRPLDSECVKHCLKLATLAPTSSNMQLWEAYHVTNKDLIQRLGKAGIGQRTIATATELVVFVVRPDYVKRRAKANLAFQREVPQDLPRGEMGEVHQAPRELLWEVDPLPLCSLLWLSGTLS